MQGCIVDEKESNMATIIAVIRAHDFIKLTPEKTINYQESVKLYEELSAVQNIQEDYQVIIDTRLIHTIMSTVDLFNLAQGLLQHGLAIKRRTALICTQDQYEGAKLFETLSQNQGFDLRSFVSYEHAIQWLFSISDTGIA